MTSLSRKKRQTTPPNTTEVKVTKAARAAEEYRAVDQATRTLPSAEPLWLPAGWLAVVVVLSSTFPAWGASAWRARTPGEQAAVSRNHTVDTFTTSRRDSLFRTVDYRSDVAGPALRLAQVPSDPLLEAIERPFGVTEEPAEEPKQTEPLPSPQGAEDLFDDLPPDPFDEPMDAPASDEPAEPSFPAEEPEQTWDDEPDFEERVAPYEEPAAPKYEEPESEELVEQDVPPFADDHLAEERAEAAEDCAEELAKLKAMRLDTIDLEIGISGIEGEDFPFVCSVDDGALFCPREWAEVTFMWKASALCHKPLYFNDTHLERYGHSWGPVAQPIISGAHFFTRFPVLPYCMGLKAPNECVYTLGHYRPGNCAPYMIDPIPFTWRAALFETGGVFAVIGILP